MAAAKMPITQTSSITGIYDTLQAWRLLWLGFFYFCLPVQARVWRTNWQNNNSKHHETAVSIKTHLLGENAKMRCVFKINLCTELKSVGAFNQRYECLEGICRNSKLFAIFSEANAICNSIHYSNKFNAICCCGFCSNIKFIQVCNFELFLWQILLTVHLDALVINRKFWELSCWG